MKQLVLEVLKKGMTQTELKHGRKVIKTEKDLLALNTKALMKLYNQVMQKFGYYIDEHHEHGQTLIDDSFRDYMFDKLIEVYDNVGILYDPTIEDEMYLADYVFEYNDGQIAQIYNHNMFDHDFINWKNHSEDD